MHLHRGLRGESKTEQHYIGQCFIVIGWHDLKEGENVEKRVIVTRLDVMRFLYHGMK